MTSSFGDRTVEMLGTKSIAFHAPLTMGETWYPSFFINFPESTMMDLNKVMLIGRSTTDVEIKKIEASGTSVVNFTVATNRRYKNKDGQIVEESEYHRCVAYGNAADVIGKYVNKGKRLYVEGRLRTRKWEDSTGQTRYTTEVVVENFIFLDSRPAGDEDTVSGDDHGSDDTPPHDDDELPF